MLKQERGTLNFEGIYDEFKTLGAKRYLTRKCDKYELTVAGLSKTDGIDYLISKYKNPFNGFNDSMYIPPQYTGKNTHTYIDDVRKGVVRDYKGVVSEYSELSAIHLSPSDYSLSLGEDYANYLLSIQTKEY